MTEAVIKELRKYVDIPPLRYVILVTFNFHNQLKKFVYLNKIVFVYIYIYKLFFLLLQEAIIKNQFISIHISQKCHNKIDVMKQIFQ